LDAEFDLIADIYCPTLIPPNERTGRHHKKSLNSTVWPVVTVLKLVTSLVTLG